MENPLFTASVFLIGFIFDFYVFTVLLRVLLQWVNTSHYNPIFVLVTRLSDPVLKPICRILPTLHGIDIAAAITLLMLEVIKFYCLIYLRTAITPHLYGLLILAFAQLFNQLITIFFYSIIGIVLLSWLSPLAHGPIVEILVRITEPLLKPIRNWLPTYAGIDFSPLVLIIILQLFSILFGNPLIEIGYQLTLTGMR
jgi:YggT family protein